MKKMVLLILCFSLTGCATLQQWQQEAQEAQRINSNIQNAVVQKLNLVGWNSQQIVQQFGNTNNVNTTYTTSGSLQEEDYSYVDPSYNKYEFQLTINNSVVTSVHYTPPYNVSPPPDQTPPPVVYVNPNPPDDTRNRPNEIYNNPPVQQATRNNNGELNQQEQKMFQTCMGQAQSQQDKDKCQSNYISVGY